MGGRALLWLAAGTGTGPAGNDIPGIDTVATNLGVAGNGLSTIGSPADFTGAQVLTGRFTGTNLQDLLYYYPSGTKAGSGGILAGNGDGSPISPGVDDAQHTISTGILTDISASGSFDEPLMLANAGNSAGSSNGFMDLIGIAGDTTDGYHLIYYPNGGGPTAYAMSYPLTVPAPDGTMNWNAWTVTTAQRSTGSTDMVLWNRTTGALYLWTGLAFATDGAGNNTLTYTPVTLADGTTSTYQQGAAVSLQAADINHDDTPDLWSIGASATTTAWLVTNAGSGTGTITAQPAQKLVTPAHNWILNDTNTGTVSSARDFIGGLTATKAGSSTTSPIWSSGGLYDPDVEFDGSTSALSTASAGVSTTGDFTVSLWTKPNAFSGNVISQDATNGTYFKIWPSSDTTWKFGMQQTDTAYTSSTVFDTASSATGTAKLGFWYHIVASYQVSTKRMTLYVNDVQVGAGKRTGTWTTSGKLQLGRMKTSSTAYDWYYKGQLADVQIWNSVVDPVLIANYDMRAGSGTTVTDWSGYGYTATLSGGYTWNTTGHDVTHNGSLSFNGSTGYAQANASLIQPTTTSFSLTAWAYLTDTNAEHTIFSQSGTNRSPFYFLYNNTTNRWQFKFSGTDTSTTTWYIAADPNPAAANTWTHLAGTYDATTHIARLYVNGNFAAAVSGVATWTSTGNTWLGRSGTTWWQGKVDCARIYRGVLNREQVKQVMSS